MSSTNNQEESDNNHVNGCECCSCVINLIHKGTMCVISNHNSLNDILSVIDQCKNVNSEFLDVVERDSSFKQLSLKLNNPKMATTIVEKLMTIVANEKIVALKSRNNLKQLIYIAHIKDQSKSKVSKTIYEEIDIANNCKFEEINLATKLDISLFKLNYIYKLFKTNESQFKNELSEIKNIILKVTEYENEKNYKTLLKIKKNS